MRKITLLKMMLLSVFVLGSISVSAQLLVEDFNYTTGTALTANGWTAHSGAGTNAITVAASSITYPGYLSSGVGNEVTMTTSGEDVNKTFTQQTTGTIYFSFLVNVTSATTTGDYFFNIGASTISTNFRGRVFVKKDASNNIYFGVSQSTSTVNYGSTAYTLNTTYLIVLKYDIVSGTTNDVASIYVNPPLNAAIPSSGWIANTDAAGTDLANVGSVALRQGGSSSAPALKLDGIRVSTTWSDIVGSVAGTPSITVNPTSLTGFSYTAGSGPSSEQTFTTSGSDLTADITLTAPTDYEISTTSGSGFGSSVILTQSSGTVASTTVYARLKAGLSAGDYNSENIVASSTGATSQNVSCSGTVNSSVPTITVTETSIPAMTAEVGASDAETIHVSGINLTDNITLAITGTDAAQFSVDPTSITQTGGAASSTTVTVTYTPNAVGSHSAVLEIFSPDATTVTRDLSGSAYNPVTTIPDIVISEVFGGGGNSGATLKNDFIELYNTSSSSIDIAGWSLQYYSATSTGEAPSGNIFEFPSNSVIPAGVHYLVQCAAGTGGTDNLPTPDATSTLALSGTAGKVILYNTNTAQTISNLASILNNPNFVDYVPYGTSAVPVWGSAMSSNTSSTTSATRNGGSSSGVKGQQRVAAATNAYSYTGDIGADFSAVTPTPQNIGPITGFETLSDNMDVSTYNGKIRFSAGAGENIQVFNAVGQRIVNKVASEGLNELAVSAKGVLVVKVGNKTAKIVL